MRSAITIALVLSGPAAAAPQDELAQGQAALAQGWHTAAFRLCMRAAEDKAQPRGRRAAALVCQGRAALGMRWPAAAQHLAQRAIELIDESNGRLLLGDAYRVGSECKKARTEYLIILERESANAAARAGLTACGGDPPPVRPDRDDDEAAEVQHA